MSDPPDHRPRGYKCPECHAAKGESCKGKRHGSSTIEAFPSGVYHWERTEIAWNDGSGENRRQRLKNRPLPTGGLDLKAMAAAWRKAGNPGDWRAWCKVHPIKKS